MHIILGGTGHVGSSLAQALLQHGEPVTIISSDPKKAGDWQQKGVKVVIADVYETEALRAVFQTGTRLFLLNPPAAPSTDTVAEERKTLASILNALDGSGIKKVVAESTYGAQPGNRVGDLGVLYEMEQALGRTGLPCSLIRAAYYMSNWDMSLQTAQQEGVVHTLYPPDVKLPMVAPDDLGQAAARLLMEPVEKTGLHYVEGPEMYSSADVAAAFSVALRKPVIAVTTPRTQWIPTLTGMGFSDKAAESMAAMTAITLRSMTEKKDELPDAPERGHTSLESYIMSLVQASPKII